MRNGVTDPYTWDLVKIMTGIIVLCMFGGAASLATAQDTKNNTHTKTPDAHGLGLVFGFDYSQPTNPRLVSMAAYGEFIDTLISGSSFLGNDIYVAGALGADTGIVQADNSAPRNAIDLYYLPLALRSDTFVAHGAPQAGKRTRHPKFNRNMWQNRKKHERIIGKINQGFYPR